MRLFERTIYINELSHVMEDEIHKDQFAYMKNHSSTTALIKAQHTWLEWLDRGASHFWKCPISGSNDSRKRHEMRLISKRGTVHPLGINERFRYI